MAEEDGGSSGDRGGGGPEPPARFVCAISLEVMSDPVMCRNGHNFERDALEAWLRYHGDPICPTCRTAMTFGDHFPNLALRENIAEWRAEQALRWPTQGSHHPQPERVRLIDARTGNLLTFTPAARGFLQYTVNRSSPRPPFSCLVFDGPRVLFKDITKVATLPANRWSPVLQQLLELAVQAGLTVEVVFPNSGSRNQLAFTVAGCCMPAHESSGSGSDPEVSTQPLPVGIDERSPEVHHDAAVGKDAGLAEGAYEDTSKQCPDSNGYEVNSQQRPTFTRAIFEGERIRFPEISRSVTLPLDEAGYLLEETWLLLRVARVQLTVQFVDPETGNMLVFQPAPQGGIVYTVNDQDARPPFKELWFEGARLRFRDIERSATLPAKEWQCTVEHLMQLAKVAGILPGVRFTDPESKNKLLFRVVRGGLQYHVNDAEPRPPFQKLRLDGCRLKFVDIDRSATLPSGEEAQVHSQLLSLLKFAGF